MHGHTVRPGERERERERAESGNHSRCIAVTATDHTDTSTCLRHPLRGPRLPKGGDHEIPVRPVQRAASAAALCIPAELRTGVLIADSGVTGGGVAANGRHWSPPLTGMPATAARADAHAAIAYSPSVRTTGLYSRPGTSLGTCIRSSHAAWMAAPPAPHDSCQDPIQTGRGSTPAGRAVASRCKASGPSLAAAQDGHAPLRPKELGIAPADSSSFSRVGRAMPAGRS